MAKQPNGTHVNVYDMSKDKNITTVAIRKVHEAAVILSESTTDPLTPKSIEDLIGHEFVDPKNVGRAISVLAHCTAPVFGLNRRAGTGVGPIESISIIQKNLPQIITYATPGDTRKYNKSIPMFPADPKPEPTPPAPPAMTIEQVMATLPKLSRRELLLLRIQVQEQLKGA
jgi:hypothetical protein